MSTPLRIVGFALALVAVFGAALGVGRVFGDERASAAAGYDLRTDAEPGRIGFSVLRGSEVVTGFDTRHEKELHLIAVRQDFGGYRHLHPVRDDDGAWSIDADLGPGRWRLFADFQPTGGDPVVVHEDVVVPGEPVAAVPPSASLRRSVHGYDVDLAWSGTDAVLTVSRDGRPVTDLEPYLGAYGHLVVLGDPGLEYLHVHPEEGPSGPSVEFGTGVGGADYRLYFEFQHEGEVHTVSFATAVSAEPAPHEEEDGGHGGH